MKLHLCFFSQYDKMESPLWKNAFYSVVFGVHLEQNLTSEDLPSSSCLIFIMFPFLKYHNFTIDVGPTTWQSPNILNVTNKVSATQSNKNYKLSYCLSLKCVNVVQF